MIQAGDSLGFTLEALLAYRIAGHFARKDFDSNVAVQPRVACAVYFTHSASTQRRQNLVGPQVCARSDGHKCRDYSLRTAVEHFFGCSVARLAEVRGSTAARDKNARFNH